jgi:hypothetical protein
VPENPLTLAIKLAQPVLAQFLKDHPNISRE